jgi:4'-phosphopantetheinyl transferase
MTPDQASMNAWMTTAIIPDLGADDLYVFRVNLPVHEEFMQQCSDVLSPQERERVARFKQELARQHALIGRGVLRSLLSRFLDIAPSEILVQPGPNGKPQVEGVSFNVAHSGDIILIAVARTGLLGVDVERINPTTPVLDIAGRYFAPTEIALITDAPSAEAQQTAFFRLWSRKEAIIKADGRGLSVELSSFAADDFTTVPDTAEQNQTFRVHSLPIGPGYAAALATTALAVEPRLVLYPAG